MLDIGWIPLQARGYRPNKNVSGIVLKKLARFRDAFLDTFKPEKREAMGI